MADILCPYPEEYARMESNEEYGNIPESTGAVGGAGHPSLQVEPSTPPPEYTEQDQCPPCLGVLQVDRAEEECCPSPEAAPEFHCTHPSEELCTPHPSGDCTGIPLVESKVSLMDLSTSMLPLSSGLYADNKSDTNSAMIPICRICHMPEDDSVEVLISPCRCAGTLQFIHNTCLMRWLEITTKKSRKPPKCELCHFQYHRHKKFKFHHWRFPRVSRQDRILHLVFIINLIIMIGCAAATVMCFLSDKGQISKFPRNKVDLTTEEIITLSCGVLFFVSFFIAMSVQIKAKHTIYQLFVKFIMQNMEWEIDEYDKSKDSLYKDTFKPAFV